MRLRREKGTSSVAFGDTFPMLSAGIDIADGAVRRQYPFRTSITVPSIALIESMGSYG